MQGDQYIYSFNYEVPETALCKLESLYIFNQEEVDKLVFSEIKAEPSDSAFIKSRLTIITSSSDYTQLINQISEEAICAEGFKVEYLVYTGDETVYDDRLSKLKDVGYRIEGMPDYYHPNITYAIGFYAGTWYFGTLLKNNYIWKQHQKKPRSYSNSIGITIAKSLVNIATKADKTAKILDACCGVGTVLLEACFAGNDITGCDNNWKVCRHARENLAFYNYKAEVFLADIQEMKSRYEAVIIDLPYNLYSRATEEDIMHILSSSAAITDRLVIVSVADLHQQIADIGFRIAQHCLVPKKGNLQFIRQIWVCERV